MPIEYNEEADLQSWAEMTKFLPYRYLPKQGLLQSTEVMHR